VTAKYYNINIKYYNMHFQSHVAESLRILKFRNVHIRDVTHQMSCHNHINLYTSSRLKSNTAAAAKAQGEFDRKKKSMQTVTASLSPLIDITATSI